MNKFKEFYAIVSENQLFETNCPYKLGFKITMYKFQQKDKKMRNEGEKENIICHSQFSFKKIRGYSVTEERILMSKNTCVA